MVAAMSSIPALLRDVWLIGWFDVREALRSRRALTLVGLYLFVATLAAYAFVRAVEAVEAKLRRWPAKRRPGRPRPLWIWPAPKAIAVC